jgi:hypothetical protein
MPPRWLSILIVILWLTFSAAFFRHEWWPYLEPGAPPPFAIDLVDEASNPAPATWKVWRNCDLILRATTKVEHNAAENTFTLSAEFLPLSPDRSQPEFGNQVQPAGSLNIQRMSSRYRVTPEGQLIRLEASAAASYLPPLGSPTTKTPVHGKVDLSGDLHNGRFTGKYNVELEAVLNQSGNISAPVSSQGSVLVPLHPVHHIRGLRPGQTWRLPVVDPLDDLLAAVVPGGQRDTSYLVATVLPESQPVRWGNQDHECLVIEYTGDEMSARTYVRRWDALVLQQEVTKSGETWILRRE